MVIRFHYNILFENIKHLESNVLILVLNHFSVKRVYSNKLPVVVKTKHIQTMHLFLSWVAHHYRNNNNNNNGLHSMIESVQIFLILGQSCIPMCIKSCIRSYVSVILNQEQ